MSEVSLIPNNGEYGWGGNGLSAAIGGFIGSWFGNGWGAGGWGGRGAPVMGGGMIDAAATLSSENAVLNNLNDVRTGLNNLGMNLIQGQGRDALTACQGFNGINTAILTSSANQTNWNNQGFAGLNNVIQQGNSMLNNTIQQGMFGLNNQAVQQGHETRNAIYALGSKQAESCCNLRQEMAAGFGLLSNKIDHNTITALQTQLCDAKSKIAALETQQFTQNSNLAQSAYLISQLKDTTTTS